METTEAPQALLTGYTGTLEITLPSSTWDEHNKLVGAAAIILRVTNQGQNDRAARAMAAMAEFEKRITEAHRIAKAPAWEYCLKLDETKRDLLAKINSERMRLARLCGDWLALEEAKTKSANQARNEELSEIERAKHSDLAKASSHEEREMIQESYANAAAALPKAEMPKAAGQNLAYDWEIEIISPTELVVHHPNLVKVEIKLREAKALLDAGSQIKGIVATKLPKAKQRGRKPIDIESTSAPASGAQKTLVDLNRVREWTDCSSTQIARYAYDAADMVLLIQFISGSIYCYEAVSQALVDAFGNSDSKGKFFGMAIKGKYPYQKLKDA